MDLTYSPFASDRTLRRLAGLLHLSAEGDGGGGGGGATETTATSTTEAPAPPKRQEAKPEADSEKDKLKLELDGLKAKERERADEARRKDEEKREAKEREKDTELEKLRSEVAAMRAKARERAILAELPGLRDASFLSHFDDGEKVTLDDKGELTDAAKEHLKTRREAMPFLFAAKDAAEDDGRNKGDRNLGGNTGRDVSGHRYSTEELALLRHGNTEPGAFAKKPLHKSFGPLMSDVVKRFAQ